MKKLFNNSLLISVGVACMALASTACSSSNGDDDSDGGSGGTSGSGGTGGSGNAGPCTPGGNITLAIDSSGWMDMNSACNSDVGVQGAWYPYGDQYGEGEGDAKCTKFGNHAPAECAQITTPDPALKSFDNTDGKMHTAGTVEKVLPCVEGSQAATLGTSGCPGAGAGGGTDYSSMWGAGIGFDLNATGGDMSTKSPWNPAMYGVVGVRFEIDAVPAAGLRVEFPMVLTDEEGARDTPVALPPGSTTDSHSAGAPFWGAQVKGDKIFPNSPVVIGLNTVLFSEVQPAILAAYDFAPERMLGVQFHVPAGASGGAYDFTISNVRLIRDPNVP